MKKRTAIRALSFSLSLCLVAFGLFLREKSDKAYYKTLVNNGYGQSFEALRSNLDDITTTLEKMIYVSSAATANSMATELLSKSETAKTALSALPDSDRLTVMNRFLSQVGNYSLFLSKQMILGAEPEVGDNLEKLYTAAKVISDSVSDTALPVDSAGQWAENLDSRLAESVDESGTADRIFNVEEALTDYPTLIYDGPYSDHLTSVQSELLSAKPEITSEAAQNIAESITGQNGLMYGGKSEGTIPLYLYSDDIVSVGITVRGGYAAYFRKYRTVGEDRIGAVKIFNYADRFLARAGFQNMVRTYYYEEEGMCTVSYAYRDGVTLCYPDLIKVGVAADTGEILLLETNGYLMNHKERTVPTPAYDEAAARTKISPKLTVHSTVNALIPKETGREAYCYEFYCTSESGEEILVYINTATLAEEDILIRINTDGGILVK